MIVDCCSLRNKIAQERAEENKLVLVRVKKSIPQLWDGKNKYEGGQLFRCTRKRAVELANSIEIVDG